MSLEGTGGAGFKIKVRWSADSAVIADPAVNLQVFMMETWIFRGGARLFGLQTHFVFVGWIDFQCI